MAEGQDSVLDFNGDLNSSQASTFCHELSMGILQERKTVAAASDEFFQVDILTSDIYTPSQQKESGYDTKTFQLPNQSRFVPYEEPFKKSVIAEFEDELSNTNMEAAAKDFIRNPNNKKNIFYPKFEYFEEKLIKEANVVDFRQYIREALKCELDSIERDKIVNMGTPELKCEETEENRKSERERCSSPDLFEEYEHEEISKKMKLDPDLRRNIFTPINIDVNMPTDLERIQKYTENIVEGLQEGDEELSERKKLLISKIEDLIKSILENLVDQKPVELFIRNTNRWTNCDLIDDV